MLKQALRVNLGAISSSPASSTMLSSSSSSSSILALRSGNPTSLLPSRFFSNGVLNNRLVFSPRFPRAISLRCFASSTGFDKVQVLNPIVEMDGTTILLKRRLMRTFLDYIFFLFLFTIIFAWFLFFLIIRWWNDEDYLEFDKRQSMNMNFFSHFQNYL